ncbi:hypothetical protein [Corynebacterium pelargi]|uniref:Uncharacterized protein n=1 Tax=Corynebacterium pelargi TaxID=1471400 RepID=A0A410W7J2_9CORY|nr:hypothetical protein [Corynebacterium pelargi]QAU51922.1 hypothetical protein CPELA_03195 [Corynebacterium pelargi]GGG71439.1 thiamine biosynthesis protein X [Corynebacterium pelargi]
MREPKRSTAIAATAVIAGIALAACSPPNENDSDLKVETASEVQLTKTNESSAEETTSSEPTTLVTTVTLKPSKTTGLKNGEEIIVDLAGLNPDQGYYTAICASENIADGQQPACTGEKGDSAVQPHVKNGADVEISPSGTAVVPLTVAESGEEIDCTKRDCVVKVFSDEDNDYFPLAEVPVFVEAR